MKRQFLQDLGIEDKETIDAIMNENGQDIEKAKEALNEQVDQANDDLKEAQKTINKMKRSSDDAEKIQKQADEYKAKYEQAEAERQEVARTSSIEKALIAGKANQKYLSTLASYIPEDADLENLDKEVAKLQETYGELFQPEHQPLPESQNGYSVVDNQLKQGESAHEMTAEQIMAIEDIDERQAAINANLDKF